MSGTDPGNRVIDGDVERILGSDLPWGDLAGRRVLVTGARGMLGSYVWRTLLGLNDRSAAGIEVVALVRDIAAATPTFGAAADRTDLTLVQGDVSDLDPALIDGPLDAVIHGASPARPALHASNPIGTIRANVDGTRNMLQLAVDRGATMFLTMSSAEVYGAQPADRKLIGENDFGGFDILNPRACYSEGKRAAETYCACYRAQYGLGVRICRFGHIYGPGMALDDGRVQADFAAAAVAGRNIVLNSAGTAVRTYTYVSDAIAGLFTAWLRGGADLAYNIADKSGLISIRELAELFARSRPGLDLQLEFTNPDDSRSYQPSPGQGLDSSRLESLGWRAQVPPAEGVARMVAHHLE
ncbi:NAD-dependent epimerase/dehydratase family protein [Flexivirga caeni]|uniref:NAD-dependent epimerase/dehydratase family protein n=1 Tax=Flexivirga caeni TaxID=2294115 RepID=A0A3M9ML53_9MICO|nr:NAD-dependent epimerase/dehydratase family protein [Flexivirga caeni]RNI25398.1 NAD-dependent epimerase/dehydratase family protein [Flexivirga caeni]